jgi:hypothetical protein
VSALPARVDNAITFDDTALELLRVGGGDDDEDDDDDDDDDDEGDDCDDSGDGEG